MKTDNHNIKEAGHTEKNHLFDTEMKEKHIEELGLGLPENYFSGSREEILALTSKHKKNGKLIKLKKTFFWIAAAGFALILTLSVFNRNTQVKVDQISTKINDSLEQIQLGPSGSNPYHIGYESSLIASLFLGETEIDQFADEHFLQEILIDEYIDIYFEEDELNDEIIFE